MIKKLLIIIAFFFIFSCKQQVRIETEVYNNNFESNNLSNITNGVLTQFNGSTVLGQYNNGNVTIGVNNLPEHDLVIVTFDLYIHDQWDGNKEYPDGPDIWQLNIDGQPYINTTFSNAVCATNTFCPPQSYPHDYPNNNQNPKAGAYQTNLPGFCSMKGVPNFTTLYKITKTINHTKNSIAIECLDKLVQPNTADPKCDESWSVDNIVVKAVKL